MAPSTRLTERPSTPTKRRAPIPADTLKKTKFFQAYDARIASETLESISSDFSIHHTTGTRWLRDRELYGSKAYRRTRKRSEILGRKSRVSKETCKLLISPSRNPIRDQTYEAQIKYHDIDIKPRALRTQLAKHTKNAKRYKMAYVKKKISPKNKSERMEYGETHQDKDLKGFWAQVVWTDEFHLDPSAQGQGYILREEGTRTDSENIQERGSKSGNTLHVAGWVNWHRKCDKLIFYNDEQDEIIKPKRPLKPRKRMYESKEVFDDRIKHWEASLPHEKEVKPKGNAMTQEYYVEHILPFYIDAIHLLRTEADALGAWPSEWYLQEDGDPSHGIKSSGLATEAKKKAWVANLQHPAQSPDLNPIEACWNILKQRVRQRVWRSQAELREVVQDEWSKITMQEVRARIAEMPERCKILASNSGKPVKSSLW